MSPYRWGWVEKGGGGLENSRVGLKGWGGVGNGRVGLKMAGVS